MMTSGNSVMTARPIASDLRQMPGPLVPVTPRAPPKAAPMAMPMAAISSSAWRVATPKCFSSARSCRMSLAGVIG